MLLRSKLARKHLPRFRKRPTSGNKYDYGNVFIFGGSVGYFGAPLLSALAAYRSGSGLVHIVVPKDIFAHFPQPYPEVMVHPYSNVNEIPYITSKMDAALFGPGLNPYDSSQTEVLKALLAANKPLVVDASGLVFLKPLLNEIQDGGNIVVTPHTGEAEELLDSKIPEKDVGKLTQLKITVVLKDASTLIASRHKGFVAASGNPGMATAGSGDVLSGIILSYLGQGHAPLEASKIGVFIQQKAGNLARDELGEDSMMASDIINHISGAIKTLK
jgi:NAD(P)H-hydrate epimerase